VDHKRLGILYILYSLADASSSAELKQQSCASNWLSRTIISFRPEVFNRLMTMHGTTMIFFVAMPVLFGFGTYLIPLMIGAPRHGFSRLNAFSFWLTAFGGLLLYYSFIGGSGLYGAARRRTWDGGLMHRFTARAFPRA